MKDINKISSIVMIIIGGISIILAGLYYFGGNVPETVGTLLEEKKFTSVVLIWGLILFAIAAILTIAFSVINVLSNRKSLKSFLMIILITAVLITVSYFLASSEPLPSVSVEKVPSPSTLKLVGSGLIVAGILATVAVLSIIASEIYRAVK